MSNLDVLNFSFGEPDTDGELEITTIATVTNATSEVVRLVKGRTIFYGHDDVACKMKEYEYDVHLGPSDIHSIDRIHRLHRRLAADKLEAMTCRMVANLYSREYHKLGEFALPATVESFRAQKKSVTSTVLGPEVSVMVTTDEYSSDGTVTIGVLCGVENRCRDYIERVVLKSTVLDEDDAVLGSSESTVSLTPESPTLLQDSVWSLRVSMLKSAKVVVSLAVYKLVAVERGWSGVTAPV